MFESIRKLRPHFFSLREIDNNISLDIKIPLNWSYEETLKPYRSIKSKIQDKNDKYSLLSLISQATQEGYDMVLNCALEIILINKEEEEKQKLFQQKVKELQELFKKESLDKLKEINLIDTNGQEIATRNGMVEQGNLKGSDRDSESQIDDD